MPKTTPFHPRLETLNQTGIWKHWSGYLVAPRYQYSETNEYYAIRNAVSLLDTSPLFKYRISGADAQALLMRLMVRDIRQCKTGRAQYTAWCDPSGYVIQDGVLLRVSKQEFWLTTAEPSLRYFQTVAQQSALPQVSVEDITDQYGILALQGPHAHNVLKRLTDSTDQLRYFGVTTADIEGQAVTISRTGFTGDLGYELWIPATAAVNVWDALMSAGADYNLTPIGTTALKMSRVEAGLLLMGVDFHSARFARVDAQRETPTELGWGWMLGDLHEEGRDFIGREAIRAELSENSSRWTTVGFEVDWNDYERIHLEAGITPPKHELYRESTMSIYRRGTREWDYAGYASSFFYSSLLRKPIGIAKIPLDLAEPGTEIDLEIPVIRKPANVLARTHALPFLSPARKTAIPGQESTKRESVSPPNTAPVESGQYDAIVIGGGHNGLVNAAYLAKSGLKTLVLERRHLVGGAAITEELVPGYKFTTFSYAISLMRPDIVQDLNLVEHGMMVLPLTHTFQPGHQGEYLFLGADSDENFHEIARYSINDAEAYRDLNFRIDRVCQAMKPLMDSIPPNSLSQEPHELARMQAFEQYIDGLDPQVREMLDKFIHCSAAEILDEYFETDLIKAMLATSGIIGTKASPRSKESGLVWLFHKMGEYDGVFGEWGFHKGGNGEFTQVLARAVEGFGGTIQTEADVQSIVYEEGIARGVRLADGTELHAKTVVSALDPRRTFTQLMRPDDLPSDLRKSITDYKFQGTAAKVNFALSDLPTFPGLEGRADVYQGFTNIGPTLDYLEEAYADCLEGRFSRRPFLDCCVQSTLDPDMSPPGKHIMSCFVMYAPFRLDESTWDEQRENLGDTVQETLEEFFPGFGEQVLHREVVTPLDIEQVVGLTEGNIFAGELFESQLFFNRPAPGWNQYRTPISGYYQCGSGTHPGGCVIGGPGKLAAQQILGDLKIKPSRE